MVIMVSATACNNAAHQQQPDAAPVNDSTAVAYKVRTSLEAMPSLQQADSLQVLYYDDPDGDPDRYSRYYQYVITKDTGVINDLLADLGRPVEERNAIKDCRSEGKIYVFSKQQALKTIYFSTKCDSCCYLYYIKDGAYLYSPVSSAFRNTLQEKRKLSQKP